MLSSDSKRALETLGARLRTMRLNRDESQANFAARLGVSGATYQKLEAGSPSVSLGLLAQALKVLGRLSDMDALLVEKVSLFDKIESQTKQTRQRATRRKQKNVTP